MTRTLKTVSLLVPLLLGCEQFPEVTDYGGVCVSSQEVDGQLQLTVEANSGDCAADHKGASFECSVSVDGLTAHVETEFQDGKDPNDACAGPLETTCQTAVEPGNYTVEFADGQAALLVPNGPRVCLGEGTAEGSTSSAPTEAEGEGGW